MSASKEIDATKHVGTDKVYERKPKIEKVPMKLHPAKNPVECQIATDTPLVESIVVMITSGKNFQQVTICRPVGSNKLTGDNWIATPTGEIPSLISNAEDPSADRKNVVRRKVRDAALIRLALIIEDPKGKLAYPSNIWGGKTLAEAANHAQDAWKAASESEHANYIVECATNKQKPKKDWKFGKAVGGFYPSAVREYEETFKEKLKADPVYQEALKALPVHETMCGPFQDRSQVAAHLYGGKLCTREQLVDVIKNDLMKSMDGTGVAGTPSFPKIKQAFKNAGNDPAKLKEFILQFCYPGILDSV